MQSFRRTLSPIFAGIIFCSLPLCLAAEEIKPVDSPQKTEKTNSLLPLKELRTFTEIFTRIKQAYVEPVDDKTLLENAIHGMLDGLDPHSAYLAKEAFSDLQINTQGEFGGLGIEVQMDNGFVRVVTPIDDTPALKGGILPRDLIVKIDDKPIKGLKLQEAVNLMRGKPGTDTTLTIVRDGENKPLIITLTRSLIKVTSVKSRTLEDGYGYIRITQFQVKTGKDLLKAIAKLQKENTPLNGLVLDLRNNPGGVLSGAVEVSDAFLTNGLIVYTKGRMKNSELRYNANPEDPSKGVPLVVLINGGSASASEIVAGALQDHKRAVILGTTSFGKGSVQTVLPINSERALKLTTARYFTPKGRSIQAEGIIPDLAINNAKVTTLKESSISYKEADLKGHLENGDKSKKAEAKSTDKLTESDFQLHEALNLLKGIHIISSNTHREIPVPN